MRKVAVLIPHYNNCQGLKKSIESIQETFMTVDLIVIDDGSKDDLIDEKSISEGYKFGKVYFFRLKENRGIEHALNYGLKIIQKKKYTYIGRLDCGDTCRIDRFEKQIDYLEHNPEVKLLGTWVNVINTQSDLLYVLKHPITYNLIKKRMYLNSMFVHPSVVFRTEILDTIGYYPTNYKAAEDYAFFFKIVKQFKAENLPEPLIDYVIDDNSISSTKRKLQVKSRIKVICDNFYFGFYPIYGLFRNILLMFLSRKTTTFIKNIISVKNDK